MSGWGDGARIAAENTIEQMNHVFNAEIDVAVEQWNEVKDKAVLVSVLVEHGVDGAIAMRWVDTHPNPSNAEIARFAIDHESNILQVIAILKDLGESREATIDILVSAGIIEPEYPGMHEIVGNYYEALQWIDENPDATYEQIAQFLIDKGLTLDRTALFLVYFGMPLYDYSQNDVVQFLVDQGMSYLDAAQWGLDHGMSYYDAIWFMSLRSNTSEQEMEDLLVANGVDSGHAVGMILSVNA